MAREITAAERRKGLNISIWDGVFTTIHGTLVGGVFSIGYISDLGAKNIHFALWTALPPLVIVAQIFTAYWLQSLSSRKPITVITAALSRLCWFAVIFLPFLFIKNKALNIFFALYVLAAITGAMAGNPWTSWMSDLVPRQLIGRYFSRRNMICAIVGAVVGQAAGLFQDYGKQIAGYIYNLLPTIDYLTKEEALNFINLGLLSLLGAIAGIIATVFLIKQPEPCFAIRETQRKPIMLWKYIKITLADKKFRIFIILFCAWSIINSFAAPFWLPYLKNNIKWGYSTIKFYESLALSFRILGLLIWGRLIDRYGCKPVIMVVIFFVSLHPLYWVVSDSNFSIMIYLDGISSGFMWAGMEIALLKMLLGSAPKEHKEMYYAVYGVLTSVSAALPQFLIGYVADIIPPGFVFLSLDFVKWVFFFTAIGRFAFLVPFSKLIIEPKSKPVLYLIDNIAGRVKGLLGFMSTVFAREEKPGKSS
ncbi:MAG: MFS transporter [Planctomycetes bacterium]|nr:MFS transporter [Planctomycetota bacterium]